MVQLLTGPLDPRSMYQGLGALSGFEQKRINAKNLAAWCEIGRAHGVKLFREVLTGTPLHQLNDVLEVIDVAGQDNLGSSLISGTAGLVVRLLRTLPASTGESLTTFMSVIRWKAAASGEAASNTGGTFGLALTACFLKNAWMP